LVNYIYLTKCFLARHFPANKNFALFPDSTYDALRLNILKVLHKHGNFSNNAQYGAGVKVHGAWLSNSLAKR